MDIEFNSKIISFVRKIVAHKNSYTLTIPSILIESGEIDPSYIYKVYLKPLKKYEKKEK